MINAIRFCRTPPQSVRTVPLPPQLRRRISPELRSRQVIRFATAPDQNHSENMDDSKNTAKETGNIMSHSFGEGYATRSDEEGFGGIYRQNRTSDDDDDTDNKKSSVIHENHPEYDKNQGSEVKEKEKSRHQTHDNR